MSVIFRSGEGGDEEGGMVEENGGRGGEKTKAQAWITVISGVVIAQWFKGERD